MKQFKVVLTGVVIGLALGLWFGVNIGRDVPWYSNPFERAALDEKLKHATGETLEKGGHALEHAGQALQDKLNK